MAVATIRDLRTQFPKLKALVARDGEVIVTDRGTPAYVLRPYVAAKKVSAEPVDYFARLKQHQPRPLSMAKSRALDEANRGVR
jgi:antitoxin (DNA-binding transcriptional repressor) of toxin-antitoxin stability system